MPLLEIKNHHVEIEDKKILNGLTLTVDKGQVAAIMGPNGSGKSTLAYVLAGKENYKVTEGDVLLDGESILGMAPDERAAKGVFLAFQYPVEVPGVATMTFLRTALNAQRKARGEGELSTPNFMKLVRDTSAKLGVSQEHLRRAVNVGFSGGEKKRNEILQMAILQPRLAVLDVATFKVRHQLFPTGHTHLGFIDYVGRQNIQDFRGQVGARMVKSLTGTVHVHVFRLDKAQDAWFNAAGDVVGGKNGRFVVDPSRTARNLGTEVDLLFRFGGFEGAQVEGGYSRFFAGDVVSAGGFPADDSDWVYVQIKVDL